MKTKPIILLIAGLTLLTGCKFDNRGCWVPWYTEGTGYLFEIPVSIYPLKNKLKAGDTLILKVVMSDSISDLREPGKDKHLLENFPLYIMPRIEKLNEDLSQGGYILEYHNMSDEIEWITLTGKSEKSDSKYDPNERKYYFAYNPPNYELTLAIIPKQQGTYVVSFSSIYLPKSSFPWLCTYQTITGRIKVNNDQSRYELLQQKTQGTGWQIAQVKRGVGYSTQYTIFHDSLPDYQPPRALMLDYCFEVN